MTVCFPTNIYNVNNDEHPHNFSAIFWLIPQDYYDLRQYCKSPIATSLTLTEHCLDPLSHKVYDSWKECTFETFSYFTETFATV